jgi:hypothetical protein
VLPALSGATRSGIGRAFGFVVSCGGGALTRCLQLERYYFERNPDTCISGTVIGHAMILNHSTIGVQEQPGDSMRVTLWLARDLGCFPLKTGIEYRLSDGAFHLYSEKRAVRIPGRPK